MSADSVLITRQHLLDPSLEHTLILVKPDGYARGLTGEILRRIEAKGYIIKGLKIMVASREILAEHYRDHAGKPFFEGLLDFMSAGPLVAIIVEGQRVIEGMRTMMGSTDPTTAPAGCRYDSRRLGSRMGYPEHGKHHPRFRLCRIGPS